MSRVSLLTQHRPNDLIRVLGDPVVHRLPAGLPPPEARAVARPLDMLTILRGGRRVEDVRALDGRAAALEARLAELGISPCADVFVDRLGGQAHHGGRG